MKTSKHDAPSHGPKRGAAAGVVAWVMAMLVATTMGSSCSPQPLQSAPPALGDAPPLADALSGSWVVDPDASVASMQQTDGGPLNLESSEAEDRFRSDLAANADLLPVITFDTADAGWMEVAGEERHEFRWSANTNLIRLELEGPRGPSGEPTTVTRMCTLEDGGRLVVTIPPVGALTYRKTN